MTLNSLQLAQKNALMFQWVATNTAPSANSTIDFRIVYKFGVRNPNTALSGFQSLTTTVQPQQDMFGWFANQ